MNSEENSVAANCKCCIYGDNDRARLKDFDKLAVTVTDNTGSEPISTDIEVSGRKCTVCNRIELDPSSFMAVTNLFPKASPLDSLYDYSVILQKVSVVDTVNNLPYNSFQLYISGKSSAVHAVSVVNG